jgi:hypothetical protein
LCLTTGDIFYHAVVKNGKAQAGGIRRFENVFTINQNVIFYFHLPCVLKISLEAGSFKPCSDVWVFHHQIPYKAGSRIFNHQEHWSLRDANYMV